MLLNVKTEAKKIVEEYIISYQVIQFHSLTLLARVKLCFTVCILHFRAAKASNLCFLLIKSGENIMNWKLLSL